MVVFFKHRGGSNGTKPLAAVLVLITSAQEQSRGPSLPPLRASRQAREVTRGNHHVNA